MLRLLQGINSPESRHTVNPAEHLARDLAVQGTIPRLLACQHDPACLMSLADQIAPLGGCAACGLIALPPHQS